jgi:transcriptional regulator with XRE-family HTH domain
MEQKLRGPKGWVLSAREVDDLRHLGIILKAARQKLGYSQRHLERLSGVDQTTISRLENGRLTSIRLLRLAALFAALRTAIDLDVAA